MPDDTQTLIKKTMFVVLGGAILAAIIGSTHIAWVFVNLPDRVAKLEALEKKNEAELAAMKDAMFKQSQQLLTAIHEQNLINNGVLSGIRNIASRLEQTNKILSGIDETQSKLISKTIKSDEEIKGLKRVVYK